MLFRHGVMFRESAVPMVGGLHPLRPVPFGAETVVGLVDMVGLLPYPVGNCQTINIFTKRDACHVREKIYA